MILKSPKEAPPGLGRPPGWRAFSAIAGMIPELPSSKPRLVAESALPIKEIAEKLGAPFQAGVIPAGTYDGQEADIPTVTVTNILVTRSDISDEEAYQMTKQLFENLPGLVAAHKAAKDIKIENAIKGLPIPLHPGAERYYKEKGILK